MTQLRLCHRKSAVGGFELLFQLAIDFLQRPNPESESRHDSFVGEPPPMLQSLARGYRRGTTDLHDLADLLKAALRHRPDRIIVGEIRGPEARVFLDALNTGHRGSLSTIHANSATDALRRLVQLAMRESGGGVPLHDVEEECRRSIDVIVHVINDDGWRRITEISTNS